MSKKNKNKEEKIGVDLAGTEVFLMTEEEFKAMKESEGEFDLNDELVVDDNGNTFVTAESELAEFTADRDSFMQEELAELSYTCADAARRFIFGYKEHWLHGIEAHIKSHNAQLTGTESYFKTWFQSWGAQVK